MMSAGGLKSEVSTHIVPGPVSSAPFVSRFVQCSLVWTNLLTNGALDTGPGTMWVETSLLSPPADIITAADLPLAPQSGTYAAWMGGYLSGDDTLAQQVTVPVGTTALRMSGY